MNHTDVLTMIEAINDPEYDLGLAIRNTLVCGDFVIDGDDLAPDHPLRPAADQILAAAATLDQSELMHLRLAHSLCPLHHVDYAICFDDQDPECAALRAMHPDHDS